jgi:hypothetical protein
MSVLGDQPIEELQHGLQGFGTNDSHGASLCVDGLGHKFVRFSFRKCGPAFLEFAQGRHLDFRHVGVTEVNGFAVLAQRILREAPSVPCHEPSKPFGGV